MVIKRYTSTALGAVLMLLIATSGALAQEKKEATQKTPAATPANPFTQAAAKAGLSKCVRRIGQITDFVTAKTQSKGLLFTAPKTPDSRISSISLEIRSPNALSYAGATFAPGSPAGECGGLYEAVTYWNNRCDDVGAKAFGKFKRTTPLREAIATLDGGPNVKVFLMPAGQGCVSIKKEMIYQ